MNWEKFNHRLRKDAEGQNNDIDIDSIWNAIEPQVDEMNMEKKKKRRAIFFWWGTGVLLLSVGALFLGNQFSQKENMAQNTDNQAITTKKESTIKKNNTDLNAIIKPAQEVDFEKNELKNKSDSQIESNSKSNFSKNKNQTTTNKSNAKSSQSSESNIGFVTKKTTANLSAIVVDVDLNKSVVLRGSHSQKNQNRVKEEILNLSSLLRFLDFSTEKISLKEEEKVWKVIPKKKENRFSIGIYGGANFTKRTLIDKGENANVLLQNRETHETPLETSQVGINLSYKILNKEQYNLEITTGLQLTSIAERYKNYSTSESVIDFWGIEYLSYGLGDEPIEIYGWINKTKTTEYKKEIFNTYRMIDIPILISYNRSFGEKWQVGIQGGIFANLSLKTEGIIPSSNLNDIDLESNEFNIFKSKVGLSYHLGLSIRRELTKHLELNFSPAVRYFGNDFANDDYGLSQKYILFGGSVGVVYKF